MAVSTRCPSDHHGPLIAHPDFVKARHTLTGAELDAARDAAIVALMETQQDAWVSVVTDGELRRAEGAPADPVAEAGFMAKHTELRIKLRLPRAGAKSSDPIADLAVAHNAVSAGAGYLQLDGTAYLPLITAKGRDVTRSRGCDPDMMIAEQLETDSTVISALAANESLKIAVCFHDVTDLKSAPFAEGLELAAAEKVLNGLGAPRYIFDCGAGETPDFSFLNIVPDHCEVVLGLLDTNTAGLPDADAIVERIDRAAKLIDTDRFSLSARHGFYPLPGETPEVAWDRQKKLLTLLLDTSSRAWGIDF